MNKNFWEYPAGSEQRAKAKADLEKARPLPTSKSRQRSKLRRVEFEGRRGYLGQEGEVHYFDCRESEALARALAQNSLPSIDGLRLSIEDGVLRLSNGRLTLPVFPRTSIRVLETTIQTLLQGLPGKEQQ